MATINALTGFRPIGLTAVLGDSRVAQIFTSQTVGAGGQVPATVGGYNHFNWGNARSGHRLKVAYNGGFSGQRSDQMLARLFNCYTSVTGCGHLYIYTGVNDIAQSAAGYTTVNTVGPNQSTVVSAANVAAVCFANIQYAAQQFLAHGGRIVTICLEPGAENYTATQIGNTVDLNQRIREFAETTQQVILFDVWKELHDPTLSTASTIRFKAGYAQEASGSGVHESNLGGYKVGIAFGTLVTANFPAVPYLPTDVNEIPSTSLTNQLLNPLMTGSAGTLGTRATGSVPTSWTGGSASGGSGTQSVVCSVGTPADGSPGQEAIMACTFGAAGDLITLQQTAVNANWNIGDIVQAVCNVSVDAGGALAGVFIDFQQNDGTTTFDLRDLFPLNNVAIGTEGFTAPLVTPPFVITGKAGSPFMVLKLLAQGSAAGTATVRWRQAQIRKRFAV